MERWLNQVAVVTGASSGIGAAVAKDLVRAGVIVVGLARRVERIEALKEQLPEELQTHLHAIKCDVSDKTEVTAAFDWIEEHLGGIDIMINNAAIMPVGQLTTTSLEAHQQVLQTNVMGVVQCTQRAVNSMRQRDAPGHVVVINSILGHSVINPPPGSKQEFNIYPATKFAVTALTEVYRQELRDFKTPIKITSISPGLVDTELPTPALKGLPMLNAEDVANAIMYTLATPPHVQIHELTLKVVGEPF